MVMVAARALYMLTMLLLARGYSAPVGFTNKDASAEARRLGCGTFIIVSQQRSGTGYVIRKLNLHPHIYAANEILAHLPTFQGRVDVLEELQRKKCSKEQDRVGFKWMSNQDQVDNFDKMGPYLADTKVKLVYLWRRNVLRQYISNMALKRNWALVRSGTNMTEDAIRASSELFVAHPQTAADSTFGSFKIRLHDGAALLKELDKDLELRKAVKKGYKPYDIGHLTVAYEDLVEASPVYNKTWTTLQEFLEVPVVELGDSHLLLIHGDKPLLAPVSNAASVKKTLKKLCKSSRRAEFEAICEEVESAKCLCDPCECVDEPGSDDGDPSQGRRR